MRKINFKKMANRMLLKEKKQARKPFGSVDIVKQNANKMSKKMTAPEKALDKMLKELKVNYEPQKIVGPKIYDFYIIDFNLLIEVDGDYWHANPAIYLEGDHNKTQKRNVKNDRFKDILASGRGFGLIRIWESDLKNDYAGVKKMLKNKLGI
jgi:very-short-patch-repair endonuclease